MSVEEKDTLSLEQCLVDWICAVDKADQGRMVRMFLMYGEQKRKEGFEECRLAVSSARGAAGRPPSVVR